MGEDSPEVGKSNQDNVEATDYAKSLKDEIRDRKLAGVDSPLLEKELKQINSHIDSLDEEKKQKAREVIDSAKNLSLDYDIDGQKVKLMFKEFDPKKESQGMDKGVIFLPGWSMGESVKAAQGLNQAFADVSGSRTYSIATRPEKVTSDSLYKEAEAVAEFIAQSGLKEVTISGHSEGGSKAMNLVSILQDRYPDVKIKGLILMDAVGLYEQGKGELAGKFAKDSMVDTMKNNLVDQSKIVSDKEGKRSVFKMVKSLFKRAGSTLGTGNDIVKGIGKEAILSRGGYGKRFVGQVGDMAGENPRKVDIKVPVILINGMKDQVSDWEKIIPKEEEDKMIENRSRELPENSGWEHQTMNSQQENYLQENYFPHSPFIRMIVPEKFGNHGLPLFRSESVANAALGLLDRYYGQHRNQGATENSQKEAPGAVVGS